MGLRQHEYYEHIENTQEKGSNKCSRCLGSRLDLAKTFLRIVN